MKEDKLRKEERRNRGHYVPQYELDKVHENKLKATAMKGGNLFSFFHNFFLLSYALINTNLVIKLFNVIHEYQKNNPEPDY